MNNACPNPNSPEWKTLVKELGEGDAMTAFTLNNNDTPTVEYAKVLLSKLKIEEKDEQLSRSSDQFKLDRAKAQMTLLQTAALDANAKQKRTLQLLMEMNIKQQEFLKKNIELAKQGYPVQKTISTSNFIGSSTFSGDPKEYEAFKLFGTFMHEVLEIGQMESLKTGVPIDEIITKEFFTEALENYKKKNPFYIENLSDEAMYTMVQALSKEIRVFNNKSFLILPEITITGTTKDGSIVVGRLDLMMVADTGEVHIFDFKTKKVKDLVTTIPGTNTEIISSSLAFVDLAETPYEIDKNKAGISIKLRGGSRTAYDTWALQLKVYENMLKQHNIPVDQKRIVALIYQTDKNKVFKGHVVRSFERDNYYSYAGNASVPGPNGFYKDYETSGGQQLERLRKIIDEEIPVGEQSAEETKKGPDIEDVRFTQEENDSFIGKLRQAVDTELEQVMKEIKAMESDDNADRDMVAMLKDRRETLKKYKDVVDRITNNDELSLSKNFSQALDAVEQEAARLSDAVDSAMESWKVNADFKKTQNGQVVVKAYEQAQSMSIVFNMLTEVIAEARKRPENKLVVAETIDDRFMKIYNALSNIDAAYKQVTLAGAIEVLKEVGEKTFTAVGEGVNEGLQLQINDLERRLEKLKAGQPAGFLSEIKHRTLLFMSSGYKKMVAEKYGEENAAAMVQMEEIEKQILIKKAQMDGSLNFSEESLRTFLEGITNPEIDYYAGAQNVYSNNRLFSGIFLDQGIASASNSDLAIASYTMMLKNAGAQATLALQNRIAVMKFEQQRDKLMQRFTVEQLNDMISGYMDHKYINDKGEVVTERRLYMSTPYSDEYKQKFTEFSINQKLFTKNISKLKAEQYSKMNTPEGPAAKEAYLQEVAKRDKYVDEYYQWMLDNCQLPYDERYYTLQKSMPQEIRDELQKRYLEIETITYQVGRGNEVLLEEHDFERIEELEQEIKNLRKSAADINPEYARYIDDFNDLFEFDTNYAFYERMRSSARSRFEETQPEKWLAWQKANIVQRPSKRPELPETLEAGTKVFYQDNIWNVVEQRAEGSVQLVNNDGETVVAQRKDLESLNWYETLGQLYEARAAYMTEDPEIKALMEERSKILNQYKVGNRLRPKHMTAADTARLDEIYGHLEMIAESKKGKKEFRTPEDRKAIGLLTAEINRISETTFSEGYLQAFDDKLNVLERAMRDMQEAENNLAIAKTKGVKADIDEAQKELNAAEIHFNKKENEFKKWYNQHHYQPYQSILDGFDPRNNRLPKLYMMERMPTSTVASMYMEEVPHPKYKIKRIKESARNPNFMQGADGVPMPKAITKDANGHYVIAPGYENSPNVSEKYKNMMKDPEVFNFYNSLMDMYFDQQKRVHGRKMGYMVPGFAANAVENIARSGIIGAIKGAKDRFIQDSWASKSLTDDIDGQYGDLKGLLRHRFTRQLPEGMQTRDAIGAIMKYGIEAEMNIAMQGVAAKSDMLIKYLEYSLSKLQEEIQSGNKFTRTNSKGEKIPVDMTKRVSELENMLSIIRYERDKHLYGQYESGAALNRMVSKKINTLFAYTSFIRIGFDVANQTKNYISGNVQAYIAAGGIASDKYTRADYMWAKSKVYGINGFLHTYLGDLGKIGNASESTMLYRFYNPAQKDFMGYMTEISGSNKRRAANQLTNVQELGYMLQDKGDTEIAITVMYAVMNHNRFNVIEGYDKDKNPIYKRDANGEIVTVPVHEIYYKDTDGTLQRRKDVEFDDFDEKRIRNTIYSEMRRAQGNYAKIDQSKFENNVAGKLVMFFRKYLVPQLLNRFGYLRPNWEGAEAAIGYWRAFAIALREYGPNQVMKHVLYGSKHMSNTNTNKMGPLFTRKVAQARRDGIFMILTSVLGMMALMYVRKKDDEDEELSMLEGNLIRVLWGVQGETTSMFPIGGGSEEYIRNFTTLTTYTRELTALKRTAAHLIYYGQAMALNGGEEPDPETDSQYYQDVWKEAFYTRKSGMFEKGEAKIKKDLMDLTGIRNFRDLMDPNYRIDQMKRNQ